MDRDVAVVAMERQEIFVSVSRASFKVSINSKNSLTIFSLPIIQSL